MSRRRRPQIIGFEEVRPSIAWLAGRRVSGAVRTLPKSETCGLDLKDLAAPSEGSNQ